MSNLIFSFNTANCYVVYNARIQERLHTKMLIIVSF